MHVHAEIVPQVTDRLVVHWAGRSKELNQETRVTVYTFSSRGQTRCLIYDMDVLRLPSIQGRYHPRGQTALAEAQLLCLDDMAMVPEKYGEHSHASFLFTDGGENDSSYQDRRALPVRLDSLPGHWTVGAYVPNADSMIWTKKLGYRNVDLWDAVSRHGVMELGDRLRDTTDAFMEGRTRGVRGYKTGLFQLNAFSAADVDATLPTLYRDKYELYPVLTDCDIRDFVARVTGAPYIRGQSYYQLMKKEKIQPTKEIAIQAPDGRLHKGSMAQGRALLGLPDSYVEVRPDQKADCTIFVQSTSYNRRLIGGTRLLVLK
jgi:hypothetical protein